VLRACRGEPFVQIVKTVFNSQPTRIIQILVMVVEWVDKDNRRTGGCGVAIAVKAFGAAAGRKDVP
jgi:hypothetical protein